MFFVFEKTDGWLLQLSLEYFNFQTFCVKYGLLITILVENELLENLLLLLSIIFTTLLLFETANALKTFHLMSDLISMFQRFLSINNEIID